MSIRAQFNSDKKLLTTFVPKPKKRAAERAEGLNRGKLKLGV